MLTRGLTLDAFKQHIDFWLKGPTWLQGEIVNWPNSKLECLSSANRSIVMTAIEGGIAENERLIDYKKYSSLSKYINIMAKVFLAGRKFGCCLDDYMNEVWGTTDPFVAAKLYYVKQVQKDHFSKEIAFLSNSKDKRVPDLVSNFSLFLDSYGILRSDCRMGRVEQFSEDVIHPLILPKARDHKFTSLVITDCHERVKHLGIQTTLNKVRMAGFRIISPLESVKFVLKNCPMCIKYNSLTFKYPKMTNLPEHRVNLIKPYSHVGIDYTGHIFVKDGDLEKKMYILIFTCLNIRSIHLELIPEMSTEHFVLALVRFINLYGVPNNIYSDNAKSFVSGMDFLGTVFCSTLFKSKLGIYNIKHKKIPLYSPWVGACWERMIRTVKNCLRKVIGRIKMDYF